MTLFLINLLLALLWASLNLFRPVDLVGGFIIGYALIWISRRWLGYDAVRYVTRMPKTIMFIIFYIGELISSTLDVVRALLRDQSTLRPGIIAFPLEANTILEILLLNNLLIFTPGTLAVDFSADRTVMYIHIIDVPDPDAMRLKIKDGLERRLLEVLR